MQRHQQKLAPLENLAKSGNSVRHADLADLKAEVAALESRNDGLKRELDSYRGLPPDAALARIELEALRKRVALLEAELSNKLEIVAVGAFE